jgi:hypothetical protein
MEVAYFSKVTDGCTSQVKKIRDSKVHSKVLEHGFKSVYTLKYVVSPGKR